MWFWWFMAGCDILIPALMILAGRMMWKHPPKEINFVIGYRTARSMKNMDTWLFAHEHCGKSWWKVGWILLIPSLLVLLVFYGRSEQTVGIVGVILMVIQLIVLLASIIPTERALKMTFTADGLRK